MKSLYSLIRKYQLLSFFGFTLLISWSIWIASPFICGNNIEVSNVLSMIGAFGPTIGAVCITLIIAADKTLSLPIKVLIPVFICIECIGLVSIKHVYKIDYTPAAIIIMTIGSLIASYTISSAQSKNKSLRDMLRTLLEWRLHFKWYAFVLLFWPGAFFVGALADIIFNGNYPNFQGAWAEPIYISILTSVIIMLFGGPLNEEAGWRGFALPRLFKKFGPYIATFILGIVWTIWHAPLHFNGFYGDGLIGFLSRFIWNIPLTFLFTWVYLRTRKNLLAVILLHTSINISSDFMNGLSTFANFIGGAIIVISLICMIFFDSIWKKGIAKGSNTIGIN